MQNIEDGDVVKHKDKPKLNCGLNMSVLQIDESGMLAQVGHHDDKGNYQMDWFPIKDLILIEKVKGGFF